jgi:antitoxin component YwqK of YwqJK toxin-antitoxin module
MDRGGKSRLGKSGVANMKRDRSRGGIFGLMAVVIAIGLPGVTAAQGVTRFTYHDAAKKNLKEIYQVRDTVTNTLHGRYISYYLNGNVESKGQFVNNETSGVWEFYYETGNLKMRGILRQNSNYGLWEYFYENGQKSMEGMINDKDKEGEWKIYYENGALKEVGEYKENKRSGFWKTYFEDGTLRGEIDYANDHGRFIEYYRSGKVLGEGPKAGARNVGHWRYFGEDGTINEEGDYANGKKTGEWKQFYPSGKVSSSGVYENDLPVGKWNYYFEDGTISSTGEFAGGKKNGYWVSRNKDGTTKSEITYTKGSGEYREYYPGGKLKIKGSVVDGKNQGKWEYYFEDGKLEGECEFEKGKGIYFGYYPTGTVQTKGLMEDGLRVGTWELFEPDGKLSGYYKPFYENNTLANEIGVLASKSPKTPAPKAPLKRSFKYFRPRNPEYHGVIVGGNPMMSFIGSIPVGVEFYNQERLGHEFVFEGIRNPFFTSDSRIPQNKTYDRGYAISVKQKFYNPLKTGMWYFAHELRFTNVSYFSNRSQITVSATEQKAEYGILLGSRLMKRNDGDGFTIDAFVGYAVGYRLFDVEPVYADVFSHLMQDKFSQTFRFGLNFGYSVSFDGRR